jgi:sulfur carrier protein
MTSALAARPRVVVNGVSQAIAPGTTVAALLNEMDVAGKRVAVERNGAIVPRSAHAHTQLADGDVLEVVIAVGGG